MLQYEQLAHDMGFTKAVVLNDITLESRPELRAYCNPQQCANYGKTWVCPPGCGTLDECQKKLNGFHSGLLVQSVTGLVPPTPKEVYSKLAKAHSSRLKKLVDALRPGCETLLVLSYGGCNLCAKCSYPSPCVCPNERMDSLGAFGIDVGELCKTAGLPYSFREDRLYLTALILFYKNTPQKQNF